MAAIDGTLLLLTSSRLQSPLPKIRSFVRSLARLPVVANSQTSFRGSSPVAGLLPEHDPQSSWEYVTGRVRRPEAHDSRHQKRIFQEAKAQPVGCGGLRPI